MSQEVENTILLSSYIDTLNMLSLMMGITFEIPILTWLLAKLGILSADFIAQYRKHAWVVAMIIAAIITPTSDVFTMLIVTFPIVLLYEVSIFLVRHTVKKDELKGKTNLLIYRTSMCRLYQVIVINPVTCFLAAKFYLLNIPFR